MNDEHVSPETAPAPAESSFIRVFFSYIFPGIFLLVAAILLGIGGFMLQGATESASWPEAPGVVIASDVNHSRSSEGDAMYGANVTYEYEVAGQKYIGDRVRYGSGGSSSSSRAAYRIAKRYPAGDPVTVRYSPANPEESVLETGAGGGVYILLGVGAVFLTVSVILFVFLPRAFGGGKSRQLSSGEQFRQG